METPRRTRLKMMEMLTLTMMIQRWRARLGIRRKKKAMESLKKHWLRRYNAIPMMLSCLNWLALWTSNEPGEGRGLTYFSELDYRLESFMILC
jgi:hypothetical protein